MNRQDYIILGIIFIMILLSSLGLLIYNVFDNTAYPDEAEKLADTSFENDQTTGTKDLTQLTFQDMQQNTTKLSRGYSLPLSRTRFQCFLPPLAN